MRIFKFNGKLVEEIAHFSSKAIELRVLRDEDKDKCPHCQKPVDTIFTIVEDSPNFRNLAKAVDTL